MKTANFILFIYGGCLFDDDIEELYGKFQLLRFHRFTNAAA